MIRILSLSLLLCFSFVNFAHARFYITPNNTTLPNGSSFQLLWDDYPSEETQTIINGSGWTGAVYKLTEKKVGDSAAPVELSLLHGTATSHSIPAKSPGSYEYVLKMIVCTGFSGCWYGAPANITVKILSDAEMSVPPPPVETATAVGSTPYTVDVNKSGEAVISIPIQVPDGINGMQPRLSLNYNSSGVSKKMLDQSPGGLLGFGWGLSGISSVSRCNIGDVDVEMYANPNWQQEMTWTPIKIDNVVVGWQASEPDNKKIFMRPKLKYDDTDKLCLDGELLVLVAGVHLRDGAQYRTYQESFKLITYRESYDATRGKNMPWIEVKHPDGSVAVYGKNPNARADKQIDVRASTVTPVFTWSIESHKNKFDKGVIYNYSAPYRGFSYQPNKQRIFPSSISYGGGKVEFNYIGVPDGATGGVIIDDGASYGADRYRYHFDGSKQLARIVVVGTQKYLGDVESKVYKILNSGQENMYIKRHGYKPSGIQECGVLTSGAYSCLSPITFGWQSRLNGFPDFPESSGLYYEIQNLNSIVDSLGNKTVIEYSPMEATTRSEYDEQFTERPYAEGTDSLASYPSGDIQNYANTNYREALVVARIKRSTAIVSGASENYRSTRYKYVGGDKGRSWLGKGYMGFTAIREQDEQSGVVTYKDYELSKSLLGIKGLRGELIATYKYTGVYGEPGVVPISKIENRVSVKTFTHANGNKTYFPTIDQITTLSYEGGAFLGASIKTNNYVYATAAETGSTWFNFLKQVSSTTKTGDELNTLAFTPTWGELYARHTLVTSRIKSEETVTTDFKNFTSATDWRVGFTTLKKHEFYNAAKGSHTDFKEQKVAYVEKPGTMAVETETRFPGDAENELVNTYAYDSYGRKSSITTSGKNIDTRTILIPEYRVNTPTQVTNAVGHITTATDFDERFLKPTRMTDANGLITFTTYDALGRPNMVVDPDGVISTVVHVSCATAYCETVLSKIIGQYITPVFYKEFTSQITPAEREYYDARNRIIRKETQGFAAGEWIRVDTQYDEFGRVYATSLPYKVGETPKFSTNTYDNLGRLIRVDNPDGGSVATVYSRITEGGYPQSLVTVTETIKKPDATPYTVVKRSQFDSDAQLVKTVDAYGSSNAVTTTFEYDALGNATKTIVNGGTDGSTQSTAVFDNAGNRTSLTDPSAGTVQTFYTALGELRWSKDNKGNVTTYAYDTLGRVKSRTSIDGTENWTYDPVGGKGLISSVTNNNGYVQDYFYQDAYRAARLSRVETKITVPGFATKTFNESMTYDNYGRPLKTTSPSGYAVSQKYNPQGYPSGFTRGDNWYSLTSTTKVGALGVEEETLPGNIITKRTYDPQSGRPLTIKTTKSTTKIQDLTYQWRTNGSLQSKVDGKSVTAITDTYDYDIHDRLKTTGTATGTTTQRTLTQTYNNLGNIKSNISTNATDAQVSDYQYGKVANGAGPHAVSSATINGIFNNIYYDQNGAITRYEPAYTAPKKFIAYNSINQPTKITVGTSLDDTNPIARDEFKYSPDGDRYYKKSTYQQSGALRTEHTFYVGDYEVIIFGSGATYQSEKTQIGNLLHVRKTPFAGSPVELQYVVHRDHLGSTDVVTLSDGSVLANMAFEPFGARRNSSTLTGNITSPQLNDLFLKMDALPSDGYTGHEALDRTGFIHMNGRVYDPQLGRFLSPDPFVQDPSNTQNWNRYSYVMNNPLKYTDPSGYLYSDSYGYTGMEGEGFGKMLDSGTVFQTALKPEYMYGDEGDGDDGKPTKACTGSVGDEELYCKPINDGGGIKIDIGDLSNGAEKRWAALGRGNQHPIRIAYHPGSGMNPLIVSLETHEKMAGIAIAVGGTLVAPELILLKVSYRLAQGGKVIKVFSVSNQQLGKKLGKHVKDFGGDPSNADDRVRVVRIINSIATMPDRVVRGTFAGQGANGARGAVDFRIKGADVVVTKLDGSFVTVLRNGVTNPSVKAALGGQ